MLLFGFLCDCRYSHWYLAPAELSSFLSAAMCAEELSIIMQGRPSDILVHFCQCLSAFRSARYFHIKCLPQWPRCCWCLWISSRLHRHNTYIPNCVVYLHLGPCSHKAIAPTIIHMHKSPHIQIEKQSYQRFIWHELLLSTLPAAIIRSPTFLDIAEWQIPLKCSLVHHSRSLHSLPTVAWTETLCEFLHLLVFWNFYSVYCLHVIVVYFPFS